MLELDGQKLTLAQVAAVASGSEHVSLSPVARARVELSRRVVEQIVDEGRAVYGVNTGFGKLSDLHIAKSQLRELQLNLVRSHSCGLGAPLSEAESRAMLLLRANVLAEGLSGCRPVLIETLIAMLERGVTPVIPEKGSVGASGDLAPLAHLALSVVGEGEAFYRAERAARLADVAGAMTLEAVRGTPVAFDERIHAARPHPGQIEVAAHLRELLRDSQIRQSHLENDPRVQDAYSLRCMPQVHGAIRGALRHAREIVEIETGSATDNPLVFAETGEVLSGGTFHGAPLALAFDYAAIAMTDLMS